MKGVNHFLKIISNKFKEIKENENIETAEFKALLKQILEKVLILYHVIKTYEQNDEVEKDCNWWL